MKLKSTLLSRPLHNDRVGVAGTQFLLAKPDNPTPLPPPMACLLARLIHQQMGLEGRQAAVDLSVVSTMWLRPGQDGWHSKQEDTQLWH